MIHGRIVRHLNTLCILILLFLSGVAHAGVFEVSANGSYRKTNFDKDRRTSIETYTAALAYYFWELSALEFSYTEGAALQESPEYNAYQRITAYGAEIMVTLADRESPLKPYVKGGVLYQMKRLTYTFSNFGLPYRPNDTYGFAPAGGVGFKLMIGKQFGIKAGVDISQNTEGGATTYDYSGTAGISFLF